MKEDKLIQIIVDRREQTPYRFDNWPYKDVLATYGTLKTGDYSIYGYEMLIAVERKSLDDLMMCLGRERERFMREIERSKELEAFAVIAECSQADIAFGRYRAQVKPQAALASIGAIMSRYRVPVIFAGDRAGGEYMTYMFLKQYAKYRPKVIELEKPKPCRCNNSFVQGQIQPVEGFESRRVL